jgi:hypothetical protein
MLDCSSRWQHTVLTPSFEAEGCCLADVDSDGELELVAGQRWWRLDGSRSHVFREIADAWLPPWGGGSRPDPHAHLREGGGPPQYKAATYDWPLRAGSGPHGLLSVGMHQDPIMWYERAQGTALWRRHLVTAGGIYESVIFDQLADGGPAGLITVPERPKVAWYEQPAEPASPWIEHIVGDRGGNWHGLGLGDLDGDGRRHVLTGTGSYAPGADLRAKWTWSDIAVIDEAGHTEAGLGDVGLISVHELGGSQSLFVASPHGRGLWRLDPVDVTPRLRVYRRHTLETTVSQLHALALATALPSEDVALWVVTGKRWQAHGRWHDQDPAGEPLLFRVGIYHDPAQAPRVEIIHRQSGVGLQFDARRLADGRMQIATSNKLGVHVFTEKES